MKNKEYLPREEYYYLIDLELLLSKYFKWKFESSSKKTFKKILAKVTRRQAKLNKDIEEWNKRIKKRKESEEKKKNRPTDPIPNPYINIGFVKQGGR